MSISTALIIIGSILILLALGCTLLAVYLHYSTKNCDRFGGDKPGPIGD